MMRSPWAWMVVGIAIMLVTSWWGPMARALALWSGGVGGANVEISVWSTSSDPERDQQIARGFSEVYPDAALSIRFRESSTVGEAVYVSFLSGNPPDVMDMPLNQIEESVAAGLIRPLDDLLERALAEDPEFLNRRLGRELEVVRFRANPDHPIIRDWHERGEKSLEAARLLAMDGRVVGFARLGSAATLTWNRRLVREAGALFPELLNEDGQPRAPRTWKELRHFAALVSEWSRQRFGAENSERPFGMVVQGQRPRDMWRGIGPLAATAGADGFDYVEGRWAWDQPGILGAMALMMVIQGDGSVLPGTAGRDYEPPRTLLAMGRAAFLIDGAHAAMRGAMTVPDRIADIAVAPIPMPWSNESEREELREFLGFDVPQGRNVREMGTRVSVITTGAATAEKAEAAWNWMHYGMRREIQLSGIATHYGQPSSRDVAEWLWESEDVEAQAIRERMQPFQTEVWHAVDAGAPWPNNPGHSPIAGIPEPAAQIHAAFLRAEGRTMDEGQLRGVMSDLADGLRRFTEATNRDLQERIASGMVDPQAYMIPNWNPAQPEQGFVFQNSFIREGASERIADLRAALPAELAEAPWFITQHRIWLQMAGVAAMLALIALSVLVYLLVRHLRLQGAQRRELWSDFRRQRVPWYFVAPFLVMTAVFVLWPAVSMFWLSMFSGTGQGSLSYVGASQYARLLSDGTFWGEVVPNSLIYMLVVAGGEVVFGLSLALLLNLPLRAGGFYRTLMFIPMVTSMAVVSIIFFGLLAGPESGINKMLGNIGLGFLTTTSEGLPIDWLHDERVRFLGIPAPLWSVMGVAIWSGLAHTTILCLAGLQSVPKDLYEAAKVDGAGALTRFWRITIPAILPLLIIIIFNSLVGAARHFGTVYIMTGGHHGTEIASTYIYKWGFQRTDSQVPDLGYAATLGVAYMMLLLVITVFNLWAVVHRWRRRLGGGKL
ncbi:MAG: ABC transporter permease subunit [Planctomycetota bacterium]|nr:MAG: ABC transporter permease subunit [Planctomycetota bacterium]